MKKSLSILSISIGLFACGDSHAEAQHQDSETMTAEKVCQFAWEQNEEQLDPADRLGNPFPMLQKTEAGWRFEVQHEGHKLLIIPARFLAFQVELDSGLLDCEVPVSWKALDSRLQVTFDPQFANQRRITMINGKAFGSETKGGLYLRHQLLPNDPTDMNLAWFLNAPVLKKDKLIEAIRERLQLPPQQALEVLQATDYLQAQGPMGIQAVAMSVGVDDPQHWALLPAQAAQLWPQLRFLPLGQATAEETLEQAWNKAGILDLAAFKLWNVVQKKMVDCATIGGGTKMSCRQVVDDAFAKIFKEAQEKNAETCIHLAWPGAEFSPYFVSSFCVDASGSVRALGSKAMMDPGFPTLSARGR